MADDSHGFYLVFHHIPILLEIVPIEWNSIGMKEHEFSFDTTPAELEGEGYEKRITFKELKQYVDRQLRKNKYMYRHTRKRVRRPKSLSPKSLSRSSRSSRSRSRSHSSRSNHSLN